VIIRILARWTGLQTELAEAHADLTALRADADALREDAAELRSDAGCLRADLADARVDAGALRASLEAAEAAHAEAEKEAAALHTELIGVTLLLRETEEELEAESDTRAAAEEALAWERRDRAAERERHAAEAEAAAETAVRQLLDGFTDRLSRPMLLPADDRAVAAAERSETLLDALRLAERHDPEHRDAYLALRVQLHTRLRDALADCVLDMPAFGRRMAVELALAPADDRPIPAPPEAETVDRLAAGVGA
jgi:hypothetical protein